DVARLPRRIAPRVPGVAYLQLRQLIDVLVDERREASQQPRALSGGDVAPRWERLGGALDRGVRGREIGELQLDDLLLRGRVDHRVRTGYIVPFIWSPTIGRAKRGKRPREAWQRRSRWRAKS